MSVAGAEIAALRTEAAESPAAVSGACGSGSCRTIRAVSPAAKATLCGLAAPTAGRTGRNPAEIFSASGETGETVSVGLVGAALSGPLSGTAGIPDRFSAAAEASAFVVAGVETFAAAARAGGTVAADAKGTTGRPEVVVSESPEFRLVSGAAASATVDEVVAAASARGASARCGFAVKGADPGRPDVGRTSLETNSSSPPTARRDPAATASSGILSVAPREAVGADVSTELSAAPCRTTDVSPSVPFGEPLACAFPCGGTALGSGIDGGGASFGAASRGRISSAAVPFPSAKASGVSVSPTTATGCGAGMVSGTAGDEIETAAFAPLGTAFCAGFCPAKKAMVRSGATGKTSSPAGGIGTRAAGISVAAPADGETALFKSRGRATATVKRSCRGTVGRISGEIPAAVRSEEADSISLAGSVSAPSADSEVFAPGSPASACSINCWKFRGSQGVSSAGKCGAVRISASFSTPISSSAVCGGG